MTHEFKGSLVSIRVNAFALQATKIPGLKAHRYKFIIEDNYFNLLTILPSALFCCQICCLPPQSIFAATSHFLKISFSSSKIRDWKVAWYIRKNCTEQRAKKRWNALKAIKIWRFYLQSNGKLLKDLRAKRQVRWHDQELMYIWRMAIVWQKNIWEDQLDNYCCSLIRKR